MVRVWNCVESADNGFENKHQFDVCFLSRYLYELWWIYFWLYGWKLILKCSKSWVDLFIAKWMCCGWCRQGCWLILSSLFETELYCINTTSTIQICLKFSISLWFITFMNSVGLIVRLSGVCSSTDISNRLTTSTIAALIWTYANRMPEQILGPSPNGIKTHRSLKAFTPPYSGSNLSGLKASGFG